MTKVLKVHLSDVPLPYPIVSWDGEDNTFINWPEHDSYILLEGHINKERAARVAFGILTGAFSINSERYLIEERD